MISKRIFPHHAHWRTWIEMKWLKRTIGAIAILGGIFSTSLIQTAHADTNDMGFSVQPTAQKYSGIGYFKFSALPNQTEKLEVTLTNGTSKEQDIKVGIKNALSSPAGNTQYTNKMQMINSKLLDKNRAMSKYVSGPTDVKLAPSEQKNVTYTVKLPDKNAVNNGTILGGLSFENVASPHASSKKSPVTVYTKLARLISIEADYDQTKSNLEIHHPKVGTNPSTPLILLPIKNDSPAIARDTNLSYIIKNSNKKTIFERKANAKQTFIMAPKTQINYMIPWQNKVFKPGHYTIDVHLKTKDQTIDKHYTFVIKNHNVKEYAKQSKTKPIVTQHNNLWLILILAGIIVILLFLLFRKQRQNKKNDKQ